jgi:eukaryotic-like serine/threonine-protein kinase
LKEQLQRTLGSNFTFQRELGGGGMSRVFVVRDESLGRDIVVKVLAPELAQGLSTERFAREVRLAAALQEPHIVPVHSAGQTAEGLPYYTMPFVRGESLRARIDKGPVSADESIGILRDVARALAYAHRQGIVHRDIKPENILLSEGTAVVTDFGIAKALQAARTEATGGTLTQTGTSLGSPRYMAPEQAAADPSTDQRADIYAWGVIAYELLSGKHPFADKTSPQQLLAAHMSVTPREIGSTAPHIPLPIAELITRCLSKDPAGRPASGGELLAALNEFSTSTGSSLLRLRSRKARAGAMAAVVIAMIVVAGVLWRARTVAAGQPPLIAVLPFETEGVGSDSSFADGLGDAVSGKLARLAGLRVIDRKSVLSLAGSPHTSPQQAGKSLGAEFVLRASVRWARGADGAQSVRVSPSLVRVSDGTTTWAGEPEIVSPADPFTIQASVATRVAEALDVAMGSRDRARLATRATNDTAAFAAVIIGKRILNENTSESVPEYRKALLQFERAYQRDPQYAEALGLAARTLSQLAAYGGGVTLFDSAAVLAQRALRIDSGQSAAVSALGYRALEIDRTDQALTVIQRAVLDNPSNVDLLSYEGWLLGFAGDSAGAWAAIEQSIPLAPASLSVLGRGFVTALRLRRYADAANFLARERALDPVSMHPIYDAAALAEAIGDSTGVARTVHELRARGGRLGAQDGGLMRHGGSALEEELAASSLASFAASSWTDSGSFYENKTDLFFARGDSARMRAYMDSSWRLETRVANDPNQPAAVRRYQNLILSWLSAMRGDRVLALSTLQRAGAGPTASIYPNGADAIQYSCSTAEVYGLLGDVDAMLPFAKRCFTMPNGYPVAYLNEPEFARHLKDPRVRNIASAPR